MCCSSPNRSSIPRPARRPPSSSISTSHAAVPHAQTLRQSRRARFASSSTPPPFTSPSRFALPVSGGTFWVCYRARVGVVQPRTISISIGLHILVEPNQQGFGTAQLFLTSFVWMLCIKDLQGFVHKNFSVLMLYGSASFSEIFSYTACRQLSQMIFAIIFFHTSEYILAVGIHGRPNVTLKSLLISKNYLLAMILSFLEYFLEIVLCPGLKEYLWVSQTGLAMVVIGEIVRKLAIITAGRSFTHLIKIYHEDHHKLVTHGVYRFVRHPGYNGFLLWAVGTQIMLCNPISTIAFAVVVWHFFAERIPYEEYFLRQFFGQEYEEYARRVHSGVPFVK